MDGKKRIELKIALLRRGISQNALAAEIGRSHTYVSRVVHGYWTPKESDVARMAAALGMPEKTVKRLLA